MVPKGFRHGNFTLEDLTIVNYIIDSPYVRATSRNINFWDFALNIGKIQIIRYISSADESAPSLLEFLRENS
jgi:dTDP-4-dehydrorhamnose 3,5-epimerase-like enzyme